MNKDIRSYSEDEIISLIEGLGQPKFRGKQLYEWIHTHNAVSYDQMTNLPKSLRKELSEKHPLQELELIDVQTSEDASRKFLFGLSDGRMIESVGIIDRTDSNPEDDCDLSKSESNKQNKTRLTVCISSQVGCSMGCKFCATGQEGYGRNLTSNEIVDQAIAVGNAFDQRVDNVVIMGQGEPFLNYDATLEAIRRMNNDKGLAIGARHITVSTSGIIDGIYDFSEEPEQFRLAVSLHTADQDTRNNLMPGLKKQPLKELKHSLLYYNKNKGRRITFEYALIKGVNDSDNALEQLIRYCDGLNVHMNLIPLNAIGGSRLKPSTSKTLNYWNETLNEYGISTSIRYSKGSDIAGACGQLKNSFIG